MSGINVSAELIARHSAEMQDLPLAAERAAELAGEVGRLNRITLDAAEAHLTFFDEPAAFLVALAELSDPDA